MLLLAAVGCSDDDDPSTVERADVTTTTLAPCQSLGPPVAGVENELEASGDVDGDGEHDALRSHSTGEETWHLEADLARGGGAVLDLQSFGGPVGVVGGADVDGDGADEVWARTGAGASTTILGLVRLDGCDLTQVTFANGGNADLPVGGSVGTSSGVECDGEGGLLAFTASYLGDGSDDRYEVTTVAYALEGTILVEGDRTSTEVRASDDEFLRYTSFRCGDLTL